MSEVSILEILQGVGSYKGLIPMILAYLDVIGTDLMAKCHRIGQGLEKVPELHGTFHIEPVHAKDGYSALLSADMPLERSASGMGRVVERYAQRSELLARKRQLQSDLEKQRAQIAKTEKS